MSVWYDVSGLYDWKGNFTGIQRVVYNLGEKLAEDNSDAHFFVFRSGSFQEVDFADIQKKVNVPAGPQQTSPVARKSTRTILQHYGMVAAKEVAVNSRYEKALRGLYGNARSTYKRARRRKMASATTSLFHSDDVVVVVDGNWQFRDFAAAIIHARAEAGFRFVHFVHDLVAIKNPAFASPNANKIIGSYFEEIFPHTDGLVAVSEATKKDIEWFAQERKIKFPSVSVVPLGSDINLGTKSVAKRPQINLPDEFILAVSTIEVRKNYQLLYYAYKQAKRRGVMLPHLVIVGRKGWMAEETYTLLTKDPEAQESITLTGGIPDQELEWLYDNCLFAVVPAFCEGWGLTIAESLQHGKCCVSSDTSSMPEAGGDLVSYVSPYDSNGMVEAIRDLCNIAERKKLEARIKAEYKPVTWQDTYKVFVDILASDL